MMTFDQCIHLYNLHPKQEIEHFRHPRKLLHAPCSSPPPLPGNQRDNLVELIKSGFKEIIKVKGESVHTFLKSNKN